MAVNPKPEQTTDEHGVKTTPLTEFRTNVSEFLLDINFQTSDYARGLMMLSFVKDYIPKTDEDLFPQIEGEWLKVKGGLPPTEYEVLVGKQSWGSLYEKYKDEVYLVFDPDSEPDPATGLFEEFDLMFRDGAWFKIGLTRYEDDPQPKLGITLLSDADYQAQK